MDKDLEELLKINPILEKLVDGNDLTAEEAEKLVYNIFVHDTEGYHLATFVGAIHAKGETAGELLGFLNATRRLAVAFDLSIDSNKTTDLSGTGGGKFKTMNVSTAASFVVAAAGYTVAKEAYYGVTSPTGSADVFAAFGVDLVKLTREQIENALKEIGICPLFYPFISPKMENRAKISRRFFSDRQVRVRSPFHLATNVYSPLPITHRIYGCYSPRYLEVLAGLFMKLGFKRTLTFYAEIGMPEISNVGKTDVVEQNGNTLKEYTLTPDDLGIEEATEEDIKTGGKEQNIFDFISVLRGKDSPKSDLVAVNAGASLYSLEDVKTIEEGVRKAKEILKSGEAYILLEKLIRKIGSPELLEKWSK